MKCCSALLHVISRVHRAFGSTFIESTRLFFVFVRFRLMLVAGALQIPLRYITRNN